MNLCRFDVSNFLFERMLVVYLIKNFHVFPCNNLMQIAQISEGVDVCITSERNFYLNLPEVQKALHANVTALPYPWSVCSR